MPVRDFLQAPNGGWAVVNGDFAVVGGDTDAENLQAVRQGIGIRCRMYKGESYLNESVGVDWLGTILVKNPNPADIQNAITTQAIAITPDVSSVASSGVTFEPNRGGQINYSVRTPYSKEPVQGSVATP